MSVNAFPLQWPAGQSRSKTAANSPYKVPAGQALDELLESLRKLGATDVVVSSNAPLKRDRRPYADALTERHDDNGVAVYFALQSEQIVIACDCWGRVWENIRAIGVTVEGMRAIQRAGATDLLRRAFSGFRRLPAPVERGWWVVLGVDRGASEEEIRAARRRKSAVAHPDAGGSDAAQIELNLAVEAGLAERRRHVA